MKEILVQKLTSRKLWIAVVGIVVGIAAAFGIQENDYAQIVGVIGSISSGIAYILGEAKIDSTKKTEVIEDSTKGENVNG